MRFLKSYKFPIFHVLYTQINVKMIPEQGLQSYENNMRSW